MIMRTLKSSAALIFSCLLFFSSLPASSQFITIIRKVKSSHSGKSEVSTVVLDAHTGKVYRAMVDTVSTTADAKIIQKNDSKRFVEFTRGTNDFSLQVDSLDVKLCRITVTAKDQGEASSEVRASAVKVILAVCAKLGIPCTVEDK